MLVLRQSKGVFPTASLKDPIAAVEEVSAAKRKPRSKRETSEGDKAAGGSRLQRQRALQLPSELACSEQAAQTICSILGEGRSIETQAPPKYRVYPGQAYQGTPSIS